MKEVHPNVPPCADVASPASRRAVRNLTLFFWVFAIILFAVQAWTSRFSMSWDGIQYLDDANEYFSGNWKAAANSQWSPGYAWLLGAGLRLANTDAFHEFPVVHLINFGIALATLAAFQYFLNGMLRRLRGDAAPWIFILIAFPAFLYATLDFTNLETVTPDLLMHVFVYLAAAQLVRIRRAAPQAGRLFALGILMGLGYLAKAPFFIYALFCFAMLWAWLGFRFRAVKSVAVIIAGFALVAGPYIAFLSHWRGHLTYGDSGPYNIVWMVNGVSYYHWHGDPPGSGTPIHPTRQISVDPPAYEFAGPIAGTYPPWFDPIYWNEGAKPRYQIRGFAQAIVRALRYYEYLVHRRQLPLIFGLDILFLLTQDKLAIARRLVRFWPLLALGIFPFAMYALVHVDPRFLSSFFVLIWLSLFAALIEPGPGIDRRTIRTVALVVGSLMSIECLVVSLPSEQLHGLQTAVKAAGVAHPQWEAAHQLELMGIRAGDPVAIVGKDLPYFWAHLARVHIVAEVLMDDPRIGGEGTARRTHQWLSVKDKIAATGAKVIVSPGIHGLVDQPGWRELAGTGIFAYRF